MNILFVTSEAVPFAKTGGLADVCGALPRELARRGQRTTLILPAYRQARNCGLPIERTGIEVTVPIGSKQVTGHILRSRWPDGDDSAAVYLIEQDEYYNRDELYGARENDYDDNCERFVFLCRATMEAIRLLNLDVDVIHAHDWPTGLIPAYLKTEYAGDPRFEGIGSLFTIHNLAYQGRFWHWDMLLTGLDWKYFNWRQMEYYGELNFLKTGAVFADAINTVSPRYAEEIQTRDQGCGLEGVLQHRRHVLSGIVNGVDYEHWNPATDQHLPFPYDLDTVATGKPKCKAALQGELGLEPAPRTPLVGLVGRLTEQKGIDLATQVISTWAESADVQWAILGTGNATYAEQLARLAEHYPRKIAVRLTFSDPLAHRIEGGADMFLMPSRYEPCGLSQLYSLKYGTVPIVRATGGLVDTITDATAETIECETATGFAFQDYSVPALAQALKRALAEYHTPPVWSRIMAAGMKQDWSWTRSANEYIRLYERIVAAVRRPQSVS